MTGSGANAGCTRVAGRQARHATFPDDTVSSHANGHATRKAPSRTPYRFVIPDDTTTPTHAETDGSFDGDAPEPGTSIEWTDLHMPVFNT